MEEVRRNTYAINWAEEVWVLDIDRAIYHPSSSTLILSDLHLGKTQHFQRAGIRIPSGVTDNNFDRLHRVLEYFEPKSVAFLGDLFHSIKNSTWPAFNHALSVYESTSFVLVRGNHDIFSPEDYEHSVLDAVIEGIDIGKVHCSHHPDTNLTDDQYNLYGHLHPGIRMRGRGRQGLRLPCFYFGKKEAILPAFGGFTGLHMIKPAQEDIVVAIVRDELIPIVATMD